MGVNKRERLTRTRIAEIIATGVPGGKSGLIKWDVTPGLGLRLRSSGSATWVFVYRPRGAPRSTAPRTLSIGKWPDVSIDQARAAAAKHSGERALGADPAKELIEARTRARWTVATALDRHETDLARRKYKNIKTAMSSLRRGLSPLLSREVMDLTRKDIVDRIVALESAGKPGAAADLRKHARVFLDRCVEWGLCPANPLAGLRRARQTNAEKLDGEERGRALDDAEIIAVWNAAADMGAFGGLVRLGLLTAMRRGELGGVRWRDIHEDRIVIEARRAKTATRHEIPLTRLMREILAAQPRGTGDIVFPSARRLEPTSISGWTQLVSSLVEASGVEMTLHDLRRTCRTLMSRCGISGPDAELSIGHAPAALVKIYNKDGSWPVRVAAFEAVSAHLGSLFSPVGASKVIDLVKEAGQK
jgi:integrase